MFGYSRHDILGKTTVELKLWQSEEDRNAMLNEFKDKGRVKNLEVHVRDKTGDIHDCLFSCEKIDVDGESCLVSIARDITERKEAEKRNLDYQERLKSLASELSSSEEQERRKIAAYLHDNISQSLALGRIEIESLRKSVNSEGKKVIEELSKGMKTVIESVQSLTFDLSSPTLHKFGLEKAVDELLDELFEKTEINYKLSQGKSPIQLDNNLSVMLFRCVRELLVNIIKHAKAHEIRVAIRRDGENIQITINDDGVGFDFDRNELSTSRTGGFGLFNIQERISFIGGSFDIQSQPDKGSRITLIVPIKAETNLSKGESDAG